MTYLEQAESIYNFYKSEHGDISEHLDTIRKYSSMSESVIELGVRKLVSTFSLFLGTPKDMTSVDIIHPNDYLKDNGRMFNLVTETCKEIGVNFQFILSNDLELNIEGMSDLVFIDTDHTGIQLRQELALYAPHCNKWIIMHDTISCRDELKPAIEEFLWNNHDWKIAEEYLNNNGLTILEKYA